MSGQTYAVFGIFFNGIPQLIIKNQIVSLHEDNIRIVREIQVQTRKIGHLRETSKRYASRSKEGQLVIVLEENAKIQCLEGKIGMLKGDSKVIKYKIRELERIIGESQSTFLGGYTHPN